MEGTIDMAIDKDMLDQLLAGREPQDLFATDGLLDELKKALSERMLSAELDDHLQNEGAAGTVNRRNGSSRKTMLTGTSKVTLDVPRDRAGTFDPKLIAKYQRRFPDFDDKIISMYARGMTVREIRGHLEELYGIDVSPDLISTVTDAVLEAVGEWQSRPLDTCYPLVFFDAIRVMTDNGSAYRSKLFAQALHRAGARHIRTRPYTPRTNGKAERFIQTSLREWAYAQPYTSSAQRTQAIAPWIDAYNRDRPHTGIGGLTPWQRVNNLLGNDN